MNLFQRIETDMTPAELALFATFWSLVRAAGVTGVVTLADLVYGQGHITWVPVLITAGSTAAAAFIHGLSLWVTTPTPMPSVLPAPAPTPTIPPGVLPPTPPQPPK